MSPLNRPACHRQPLAIELAPDLIGTVDLQVELPHPLDVWHQGCITLRAHNAKPGCAASGMESITRRGDLQDPADRFDHEGVAVPVDKISQNLSLRSSSAWAKKALASFRISFALRNSLISRSIALMHSRSSLVTSSRKLGRFHACAPFKQCVG